MMYPELSSSARRWVTSIRTREGAEPAPPAGAEQQEELRAGEARYRSLVAATTAGIVLHDAGGRIVDANGAAQRIMGQTLDQLRGMTTLDTRYRAVRENGSPFPEEEHPVTVALRAGQTVHDVTIGIVQPGGETQWNLVSAAPVIDPATGAIMGAVATFVDISDRKQMEAEEQRLRAEAEKRAAELDATLNAISDGLIIYGPRAEILRMNREAERIMGITAEKYRTLSMEERVKHLGLTTPEGRPLAPAETPPIRVLRGETLSGYRMAGHPHGVRYEVQVSGAPIRDEAGHVLAAVMSFVDITPLTALQEQRDDMLRAVSHDLRNPLAGVLGQAQLLDRQWSAPAGPSTRAPKRSSPARSA
jgi:PAS domain S-box-containing protein